MDRTYITVIILVIAPILFGSCEDNSVTPKSSEPDRYVFEIEFVNCFYECHHRGIYINSNGVLHQYNNDENPVFWQSEPSGYYTPEQLFLKYNYHDSAISVIPNDSLLKYSRLIDSTITEIYSDAVIGCMDCGSYSIIAYKFIPGLNKYRQIILANEGVTEFFNTSANAIAIVSWLKQYQFYVWGFPPRRWEQEK